MFFEGSEKKFEAIFSGIDMRTLGIEFYKELVATSMAEILSSMSNDVCDAYLLSESSLFVWSDRVLMITCGSTTLIRACLHLINKVGKEKLESLIFQRKNEYYSHLQHTTFKDDLEALRETVGGTFLLFGHEHEHHNCLFHYNKPFTPAEDDKTFELLMYDICESKSNFLTAESHTKEDIRSLLKLDAILPEFEIDDYAFTPYGYSMNALKGDRYCTVHVTPQKEYSYVSFETNIPIGSSFMATILEILKPDSFDIVAFEQNIEELTPDGYNSRAIFSERIDCGYRVDFGHYYRKNTGKRAPRRL